MTIKEMSGAVCGRLTVVCRAKAPEGRRGVFWLCRCACGTETIKYGGHLRNGSAVSCGCSMPDSKKTHGMSKSPEYKMWENARSRCRSPKNRKYPIYGGRGISMSERWVSSFATFIKDMGPRPSPAHTLDRIDPDGDYEPSNCRWATWETQNNNRGSFNRKVKVSGRTFTVAQASREFGVPHGTILSRLNRGASDDEAVRNG